VEGTGQPAIADRRLAAPAERSDVVDLEAEGGAADASGIERKLALPLVPSPDGPLHGGGDVAGLPGGARVLLRPLHLGTALGLGRQQQVKRGLQHLLCRGTGLGVPLPPPRGRELVEELLRDRHVEAAEVRSQRFDGCSTLRLREIRR
jgi:hypothetical protein